MTREEQEKLGKEIVEKLNKGEKVSGFNISYFYNIKQLYFIKTEEIDSNKFNLIALPIDSNGESLLEVMFEIKIDVYSDYRIDIYLYFNYLNYYIYNGIYHCFTKFKLTGNFWEEDNLDYWLVRRNEKFRWIREKLKIDDPEYNLAMYELFGFNEEYVRKKIKRDINFPLFFALLFYPYKYQLFQ